MTPLETTAWEANSTGDGIRDVETCFLLKYKSVVLYFKLSILFHATKTF